MGFGLLYKLIPLLSISSQLHPILHLEHFHIFEYSIDPSILGSSYWGAQIIFGKIFGRKRVEITGEWRRLHNE
jgi:hypothetical protein